MNWLVGDGRHLTAEGIAELEQNGKRGVDQLIKTAIDTDLRDVGDKWLPEELHKGRLDYIQGPAVLQLMKLRNISAPKENEESQTAPRLLRLSLTDGHINCTAIEIENLKNINLGTPPGTKVMLEGAVDVENNFLLLTNKNFRCLGGKVEKLVETWELKRKLAKQSRSGVQTEGGPPLFVPFGKKMPSNDYNPGHRAPEKKENFKSLESSKKDKKTEESEFEQQRQATIAEALQEGKTKTFGGGMKQHVSDKDVARIVEMGFTPDQASTALRQTNGNVNDAISSLISRGGRGPGRGGDRGDKFERRQPMESRQGGRGRRGRDRDEDEEGGASSRPSGPATLFDFLETKIPVKEESKSSSASSRPTFNNKSSTDSSSTRSNSGPNGRPHYENNSSRSGGYKSTPNHHHQQSQQQDFSGQNFQNRKQNLPPRLAGRHGQDGPSYHQQKPSSQQFPNFDSDRTQRGEDSHRRTDNQTRSNQSGYNAYERGQKDFNQSRPKSGSYNYNDPQEYKENRYNSRQNSQHNSKNDGPQEDRRDNRFDNQRGSRQAQGQRSSRSQQDGSRKPYEQQQSQQHRHEGPPQGEGHSWRKGDQVMAKYWEDSRFYMARIEDFASNGATCVVTFLEYGNMEEVLLSDIEALSQQTWQPPNNSRNYHKGPPSQQSYYNNPPHNAGAMVMQGPPPFPGQAGFAGPINSMEFRRSGNGAGFQGGQARPDKRRPTQQYYQPQSRQFQS
ncbi:tudor domain-containing protein 3-like isoform X2 [Haliotis cracherodii]|uniref:tudor domain-containing protein 3-like isoform X2 n=1 Tax=Haliotis cracherodii TaxID=6455 RepID=UPI0039ECEE2D